LSLSPTLNNSKSPKISVTDFFDLLLEELKQNPELRGYYRFLSSDSGFLFRKAYFIQRLQFIADHITDPSSLIWDCGSGYGTTCLYLSLNGFKSFGSTLEYYYKEIPNRLQFWKKYGDVDLFTSNYEDIYDSHPEDSSIDIVILQDTLHHLEPLQKALAIFDKVLKPNGRLILVEENGSNIVQNLKLYLKRGSKRVVEYYDEKLQKSVIMGNENIRGYVQWQKEFTKQNFRIIEDETQYVRFFPPFRFNEDNYNKLISREQQIWKRNIFLKEYFFYGINFIVEKQK
jgi:SAM-dependent methyltransferase